MIRPLLKVIAIVTISLTLVVGSFVLGNFGLSEGAGTAVLVEQRNDVGLTEQVQEWLEARGFTLSREYNFADGFIWLCVALALWDSLRDRKRLGIEAETKESLAPRTFKRLKHPPESTQPKRHHKYSPSG